MFKYLKLLAMWKDVSKVYKEENGIGKPWYISRRFFGVVFVFIGGSLYAFFGITIPTDTVSTITDNLATLGNIVKDAIPVVVALYGAITSLIGVIKKNANKE